MATESKYLTAINHPVITRFETFKLVGLLRNDVALCVMPSNMGVYYSIVVETRPKMWFRAGDRQHIYANPNSPTTSLKDPTTAQLDEWLPKVIDFYNNFDQPLS